MVVYFEKMMERWQKAEETRKDNKYCTDSSGAIVYLRALQGHSGRNTIDLSFQDNVMIQSNFFPYIYHARCAWNLHSIFSSGLILGGQILSHRLTVFFLFVDRMYKKHKDLDTIDFNRVMHDTCIKHGRNIKTRCFGSTSILLNERD